MDYIQIPFDGFDVELFQDNRNCGNIYNYAVFMIKFGAMLFFQILFSFIIF